MVAVQGRGLPMARIGCLDPLSSPNFDYSPMIKRFAKRIKRNGWYKLCTIDETWIKEEEVERNEKNDRKCWLQYTMMQSSRPPGQQLLLAVHGEEASAIPAGLRPLHQAGALRHLTHPRGQVRDVDEEVLRPRQAVAPRAPQQPQQSRPAAAGASQHRQRRSLEVSIRIFHMNYRLDVASLIADPKRLLISSFRQRILILRLNALPSPFNA